MAIDDAYATAEQYRSVAGMTDSAKDDDIILDLKAVSRFIESKVGRFFNKDAQDVSRIYIVSATQPRLWIDDLSAAPTAIELDYTNSTYNATLEPDDYELWPLNADKEPEQKPFSMIKLSSHGKRANFTKGDRVKVTGKYGWPAVPAAVSRATIQLTAMLRLETPRATRRIPELGEVIEASPDAMHIVRQLLDRYKRERYV